ncbi:MAG: hypothetical protein U0941_22095 [Planctomycetaceae bacterium]
MNHDVYDNPLIGRYASAAMCQLWSPQTKHSTWRRLWIALAEVQRDRKGWISHRPRLTN